MATVSFDTGVLIGLDRGDRQAWAWMKRVAERGEAPIVCAAAVAESWRNGRTQARLASALHACEVHNVTEALARTAGEALANVPDKDPVDAMVAATAAGTGSLLVTTDPLHMQELAGNHFRSLRIATLR